MKVLFILPEIDSYATMHPGIGQLSAVLKEAGHETDLIEFDRYDLKQVFEKINTWKPGLIAISTNTHMFPYTKKLTREIRRRYTIKIIVGGVHIKLSPECIEELDVDGVCIGDGDNKFLELVNKMEQGKDYSKTGNFWFKKGNSIIKNPVTDFVGDLDSLPIPDYSIFKHFKDKTKEVIPHFMFSRGCPFNCTYCCNNALIKRFPNPSKYVRMLSVKRVMDIMEYFDKNYNFKHFEIDDDTFSLNKKWVLEFCREFKKRFKKTFVCNIRVETADEEILQALKEAGCVLIKVGVETGNEGLRQKILGRFMKNEQIIKVFDIARKLGLKTCTFNMIGIPGETKETIRDTINLNIRLKPDFLQVSLFYPYKNTELYDVCIKNKYIRHDIRNNSFTDFFMDSMLNLPTISHKELIKSKRYFKFNVYRHYSIEKVLVSLFSESRVYRALRGTKILDLLRKAKRLIIYKKE